MDAETGPARAGLLLAGLGFSDADQKQATRSFSGGWRMRLALARALFVKPDVRWEDGAWYTTNDSFSCWMSRRTCWI